MKYAIIATFITALMFIGGASAQGHPKVNVLVIVPSSYVSNATPDQAVSAAQTFLGSPSDAPCIGSTSCSIEGWFKHELGQVFDYQIQTITIPYGLVGSDPCGSAGGGGLYWYVNQWVSQLTHYNFGVSERDMEVLMGAGGWAGHFSPADRQVEHFGMVGDWGVMEQFNERNACIPDWDYPNRGFSHEFAGMMGMYVTDGYNGALFSGDTMTANNKADLMHYSGKWLYAAA
jgi:hypothetical protein